MKRKFPTVFGEEVMKSVLIKGVDGGSDENPRFEKNILMAVKTFKVFSKHMETHFQNLN